MTSRVRDVRSRWLGASQTNEALNDRVYSAGAHEDEIDYAVDLESDPTMWSSPHHLQAVGAFFCIGPSESRMHLKLRVSYMSPQAWPPSSAACGTRRSSGASRPAALHAPHTLRRRAALSSCAVHLTGW